MAKVSKNKYNSGYSPFNYVSNAASIASAGSAFGPVGAIAGAGLGILKSITEENQMKEAARMKSIQDSMAQNKLAGMNVLADYNMNSLGGNVGVPGFNKGKSPMFNSFTSPDEIMKNGITGNLKKVPGSYNKSNIDTVPSFVSPLDSVYSTAPGQVIPFGKSTPADIAKKIKKVSDRSKNGGPIDKRTAKLMESQLDKLDMYTSLYGDNGNANMFDGGRSPYSNQDYFYGLEPFTVPSFMPMSNRINLKPFDISRPEVNGAMSSGLNTNGYIVSPYLNPIRVPDKMGIMHNTFMPGESSSIRNQSNQSYQNFSLPTDFSGNIDNRRISQVFSGSMYDINQPYYRTPIKPAAYVSTDQKIMPGGIPGLSLGAEIPSYGTIDKTGIAPKAFDSKSIRMINNYTPASAKSNAVEFDDELIGEKGDNSYQKGLETEDSRRHIDDYLDYISGDSGVDVAAQNTERTQKAEEADRLKKERKEKFKSFSGKLSGIASILGQLAPVLSNLTEKAEIETPIYDTFINPMASYNISPQLNNINNQSRISRYNQSVLGGGAGMAYGSALYDSSLSSRSNIYDAASRFHAEQLAGYADRHNTATSAATQENKRIRDLNAKNREAAKRIRNTGLSQLSKFMQNRELMANQKKRDSQQFMAYVLGNQNTLSPEIISQLSEIFDIK